jgi:hypothetical protein
MTEKGSIILQGVRYSLESTLHVKSGETTVKCRIVAIPASVKLADINIVIETKIGPYCED